MFGKGAKERIVPVGRAALEAIRGWLAARAAIARPGENAMFVGRTGSRIELPMTRQDVADYLCLTIETVCRTLADLRRQGAVAVDAGHAILIRDRKALIDIAGQ